MQRVLVSLLIAALVATSSLVSVLHTHVYTAHDHPEHHHALSVHEHHAAPTHPDAGVAHLEGCDPGKHTVRFAFVCTAQSTVYAAHAEVALPATPTPEIRVERNIRLADVRVHGPPPRRHASPRAPPLIIHA